MFDEGFLSSSRRVLPISEVAENVSVLTEQQIKQWNAHTLGDVITHVIGVYIDRFGTIGNYGPVGILGSDFRHVLVMIDGLEISTTSDRHANLEFIPVHIIDRVEVIKGPASSAWGSSLGGVINVITKNPGERPLSGFVHGSYGSYATYDTGAEIRGQVNRLGYYLYGNYAHTNGSRDNTEFSGQNIHGKAIWDLGPSDSLTASFGYSAFDEGSGVFENDIAAEAESRFLYLSLKMDKRITEWLRSEAKFEYASFDTTLDALELRGRSLLSRQDFDEVNRRFSLVFLGEAGRHDFAAGFDYKNGKVVSSALTGGGGDLEQWAFFANGTVRVGPLNITPGIRYDDTSTNGNNTSPSLGLSCRVSGDTVLKFYVAEGFSIPPLSTTLADTTFIFKGNPDLEMERVTTYQAGIEFAPHQSVAAKVTAFLHNTRNTLVRVPAEGSDGSTTTEINGGKQRIQGFDAEIRASLPGGLLPYFGMAFIDSENRDTGERIRGRAPRYLYNIGVTYVRGPLRASLDGRYVWWDAPQEDGASYDSFIFDLNVTKTFRVAGFVTPELFLSVKNLFNNVQYAIPVIRNPKRVFEGGIRAYF